MGASCRLTAEPIGKILGTPWCGRGSLGASAWGASRPAEVGEGCLPFPSGPEAASPTWAPEQEAPVPGTSRTVSTHPCFSVDCESFGCWQAPWASAPRGRASVCGVAGRGPPRVSPGLDPLRGPRGLRGTRPAAPR